jgi:invasin B
MVIKVSGGVPLAGLMGIQPNTIRDGASKMVDMAQLSAADVLSRLNSQSPEGLCFDMTDAPELAPPASNHRGEGVQTLSYSARLQLNAKELEKAGVEAANTTLYDRLEQSKQSREAQTKDLKDQAVERERQLAAAGVAGQVGSCAGMILQAIVTVFSVVGAVFTAGASLAGLVANLAIPAVFMGADALVQHVTGKSMMEQVFTPIAQALATVATEALKAFGVDAETANTVGNVMGMVLAAVAIVAVMVVGARGSIGKVVSAAVKSLTKRLPQMAQTAAQTLSAAARAATQAVGSGIKAGARVATRVASKVGLHLKDTQKLATPAKAMAAGAESLNAGFQAGSGIAEGVFEQKAADVLAKSKTTMASVEIVRRGFDLAVSMWQEVQKECAEIRKQAAEVMFDTAATCTAIIRQSGSVRA